MPFKPWSRRAVYFPSPTITQFDLPVLIDENNVPADFFSIVQNGGSDLRCCQLDSRGFQQIPCEVVTCDTGSNILQLWMKPTTLDSSIPLFVYYGNPNVSDASTPFTWNGSYKQIYHMEETTGNFIDFTSNASDATTNGTLPNAVSGIVEDGQDFDGSTDWAEFNRDIDGDFTIECWINTTASASSGSNWFDGDALIDGSTTTASVLDFGMSIIDGATAVLAGGVGNPDTTIKGTTQINDGNDHHCVFRRSGSSGNITLFVDGVQDASGTATSGTLNATNTLSLGRTLFGTANFYDGIMDEVRISSNFRGNNYILNTFNSIDAPASMMVLQTNL